MRYEFEIRITMKAEGNTIAEAREIAKQKAKELSGSSVWMKSSNIPYEDLENPGLRFLGLYGGKGWECESNENPHGECLYDEDNEDAGGCFHDACIYCGEPFERK